MRSMIKAAIIAFGAIGALAGTASAQPYEDPYYGGDPAYGPPPADYGAPYDDAYADPYAQSYYDPAYGYCDPYYGCPDDYYDLPLYYGSVFYDGAWLNGPFYWRDYGGHRQFWTHGGWHDGQYRGGRFGPALGRNFYAQRGFGGRGAGRGGNWGGQAYAQRSFNGGNAWNNRFGSTQPGGNAWNNRFGGGMAPGGNAWSNRGFAGRGNFQAQSFQGRGNWGGGWGHQNVQAQAGHSWGGGQAWGGGGGHSWGGGGGHNWGGGGGGHAWGGGGGDRGDRHHH